MGLEYALLVWWTPIVKQEGGFPAYYYATILLSYSVHQVRSSCYYYLFYYYIHKIYVSGNSYS